MIESQSVLIEVDNWVYESILIAAKVMYLNLTLGCWCHLFLYVSRCNVGALYLLIVIYVYFISCEMCDRSKSMKAATILLLA